jgi:hypothetical protein
VVERVGAGLAVQITGNLVTAHFDRDAKMNALRQRWLGEFQKVLPTKLVVRVMQIDRRLSLLAQFRVTTRIPLAY